MKCVCGTIKKLITLPSKQEQGIKSLSKESGIIAHMCMAEKVRWAVPYEKDRWLLILLLKNEIKLSRRVSLLARYSLPDSAGRTSLHESL